MGGGRDGEWEGEGEREGFNTNTDYMQPAITEKEGIH